MTTRPSERATEPCSSIPAFGRWRCGAIALLEAPRTDFGSVFRFPLDALLAELCIRHELTMLTGDKDFTHIAAHCTLKVWKA